MEVSVVDRYPWRVNRRAGSWGPRAFTLSSLVLSAQRQPTTGHWAYCRGVYEEIQDSSSIEEMGEELSNITRRMETLDGAFGMLFLPKGMGYHPLMMIYGLERNRYPVLIEEKYSSSLLLTWRL